MNTVTFSMDGLTWHTVSSEVFNSMADDHDFNPWVDLSSDGHAWHIKLRDMHKLLNAKKRTLAGLPVIGMDP